MEAATALRPARVQVLLGRVIVDHVVVDDAATADFVRRRAEAGDDPARVVCDAVEVGARVLDREQAGATVEVLQGSLEQAKNEGVGAFQAGLEQAFGPESGHVTRVLQRHFGADSSAAVQHQVRAAVGELLAESREKLFKQFSSAEESNPLATFQRAAVAAIRQSSDNQHAELREMRRTIVELTGRVQALQAEKDKALEVAAEHARSTAKGRPYEEAVAEAVDAIARGHGDDCDAVATSAASAGARATWWSTSTAAPAPPAGGSCSRPRTPAARARRRWPS